MAYGYARARPVLSKLGVGLTAAVACSIGLLPAALYIGRGFTVPLALLLVASCAGLTVAQIRPSNLHLPSPPEFAAAALSAIAPAASVSLVTLVIHRIVYGVFWLIDLVAGLFGNSLAVGWRGPADAIAIISGALLLPGIVVSTTKGIWQLVFPSVTGYGTPFRGFVRSGLGRAAVSALLLLSLTFMVFTYAWPLPHLDYWICLLIAFGLVAATLPAWRSSQQAAAPRALSSIEEAVGAMLRSLGFRVVARPRTRDPEIDPYLADLDFVIAREQRTYAVMVQVPGSPENDLQLAYRLLIARHALATAARKSGEEEVRIDSVLVVVGGEPSAALASFAAEWKAEGRLIVVPAPDAAELQAAGDDEERLRTLAQRTFASAFATPSSPPDAPDASPSAPGPYELTAP